MTARITGRQRLLVFLLLGASFMLSVDFSILNVALPQVGAAVGLELSQLPWVVTAYALPAAGFTLLFGRIADLYGRRRLFLTGIVLLTLASILGGLADSPALLMAARALQGLATAIATPAALSLLITSFSDDKQRAQVLRREMPLALENLLAAQHRDQRRYEHVRRAGYQPREGKFAAGDLVYLHRQPADSTDVAVSRRAYKVHQVKANGRMVLLEADGTVFKEHMQD